MSTRTGNIQRIAGPLIEADGLLGVTMFEVCRVGTEELIGEVNRVEVIEPIFKFMKKHLD